MSERQTRRPEGEGVHGPFIRPHPASVTAGLRVTPEGRSLLPSVPSAVPAARIGNERNRKVERVDKKRERRRGRGQHEREEWWILL